MWNIIINLIYEQSYERFLSEALSVEVQLTGALPDWGTGVVMREDLASSSFLAVIVVSLIVVCAGFLALGIWNPIWVNLRSARRWCASPLEPAQSACPGGV
jgi:hypothetical protein